MAKNKTDSLLKGIYRVLLVMALFTGFGNMPIYKRYYISNIPGLGWSGNFYINLYVHYIAGALLLGLAAYVIIIFLKARPSKRRLTTSGTMRAAFFGITLLSGILLAVRNLSQVNFAFGTQMAAAFFHLGMAMILLVLSIGCGIAKIPWTHQR